MMRRTLLRSIGSLRTKENRGLLRRRGRELAALAHAALELPHVLLARDVLNQKGPLAITRAIELAELILSSEATEHGGRGRRDDVG
jgi:hypothetical protein